MDASMNAAIAATIPLLTAPLADICSPSALDSLHVILMSTLSEHLAPTWDAARPSLGAASRVLHLSAQSSSNPPRPLAHAAMGAGIKASSWVALLLAHYRGSAAMSISIDPGMVAIQFAESPRPVVFWQEDVSPVSSRAVSPTSSASESHHSRAGSSSTSMSMSAEAPWNARKSRLPSLVAASARQANPSSHTPKALPYGTPRTPQSFAGFSFPPQSQQHLPTNEELFGEGHQGLERRWLGQVLDLFPETPAVDEELASGSKLNASAPVYRPPHARSSHTRTDSTSSYSSSSSSSSSSNNSNPRSDSRRPTLTPASVAAAAAAAHAAHQKQGIYGQLALNMSQLSLASTSSTAPSLSSASSTSSHSSASSYRAASPTSASTSSADEVHSYSLSAPVKYMDADLPSPLSPTASAYAYVDHSARRDVTEYECGKVGVLGGAVMLGVPAHKKRNSGSSLPKRGAVPTNW